MSQGHQRKQSKRSQRWLRIGFVVLAVGSIVFFSWTANLEAFGDEEVANTEGAQVDGPPAAVRHVEEEAPRTRRAPLVIETVNSLLTHPVLESAQGLSADDGVLLLQDLGMYGSGTNLFAATMRSNFNMCEQGRRQNCVKFASMHKHSSPRAYLDAARGIKSDEKQAKYFDVGRPEFTKKASMVVTAMIRDPLSQLQSWKKEGYGLSHCIKLKGRLRWLTEPCSFIGYFPDKKQHGKGASGGNFDSLPDVWNGYVKGYRDMFNSGIFKDVVLIRYEDLVMHPEGEVARVALALGLPVPKTVSVKEDKAKAHGNPNNRDSAVAHILKRSFVASYSAEELRHVCELLDLSLVKEVGYEVPECGAERSDSRRG